jgi:DNA polymerase III alpha subunit
MYIPLRVFSPFSVGFGAVQLTELADFCTEHGIPAAGIADRDTMGGSMTISKALAGRGVQPLIGGTFRLAYDGQEGDIVLFASSNDGYRAMLRLANRWNTTLTPTAPDAADLADILGKGACDIIAMTAGRSGLLEIMIDDGKSAVDLAKILNNTFPGSYLGKNGS